jgi:hypothetical protein
MAPVPTTPDPISAHYGHCIDSSIGLGQQGQMPVEGSQNLWGYKRLVWPLFQTLEFDGDLRLSSERRSASDGGMASMYAHSRKGAGYLARYLL